MFDERTRALKCEELASRFEQGAEKNDARAVEWRERALQACEAEENRGSPEQRARVDEMMGNAGYWEERAAWGRKMAGKFRSRAAEHRARSLPGL